MALTAKQQAFVYEYPVDFNATKAAIRAGYSERTAHAIGHENLKKPEISAAIDERVSELAMSAGEVLVRLGEQAKAAYAEYIGTNGAVDLAAMKRDGKMHLVKTIKETKYGRVVEFYDAQTALIQVGRHHKLFTDKTENETEFSGVLTVAEWKEKAAASRNQAADTIADFEDEE